MQRSKCRAYVTLAGGEALGFDIAQIISMLRTALDMALDNPTTQRQSRIYQDRKG